MLGDVDPATPVLFKQIVCGVDFSECSMHALECAMSMAQEADAHLTVWLICWMPGHDTGFHDHDGSAGAVAVLDGAVVEERLRLLEPPATAIYGPGEVLEFGPADIHRVRHHGTGPAVTIHAYSPALRRMGAYVADDTGRLLRHALDEDTELRAEPA